MFDSMLKLLEIVSFATAAVAAILQFFLLAGFFLPPKRNRADRALNAVFWAASSAVVCGLAFAAHVAVQAADPAKALEATPWLLLIGLASVGVGAAGAVRDGVL